MVYVRNETLGGVPLSENGGVWWDTATKQSYSCFCELHFFFPITENHKTHSVYFFIYASTASSYKEMDLDF